MEKVVLVYRVYNWDFHSRELVYIGKDKEDCIAQVETHTECTKEQAEELRIYGQSQCNIYTGYGFDIEEYEMNTFVI